VSEPFAWRFASIPIPHGLVTLPHYRAPPPAPDHSELRVPSMGEPPPHLQSRLFIGQHQSSRIHHAKKASSGVRCVSGWTVSGRCARGIRAAVQSLPKDGATPTGGGDFACSSRIKACWPTRPPPRAVVACIRHSRGASISRFVASHGEHRTGGDGAVRHPHGEGSGWTLAAGISLRICEALRSPTSER
jgi:hypothetical protein